MDAARDDELRASMFATLRRLEARWPYDLPYRGGLDAGFIFDGQRVPLISRPKGIFRAARQSGPAALSIVTTTKPPYADDRPSEAGWWYHYQAGDSENADNRALRAAFEQQVPIVHYFGTRPFWYKAIFPCYVVADDPVARRVQLSVGSVDSIGTASVELDPLARRYANRTVRTRLHQARFRGIVISAYESRCAICRLNRSELIDASHIAADADDERTAVVTNGVSLCSIHHRAFDEHLVGISPDYDVRVSRQLLEEDDGPMLELLKTSHRAPLVLPRSARARPDRERLAARFELFLAASG